MRSDLASAVMSAVALNETVRAPWPSPDLVEEGTHMPLIDGRVLRRRIHRAVDVWSKPMAEMLIVPMGCVASAAVEVAPVNDIIQVSAGMIVEISVRRRVHATSLARIVWIVASRAAMSLSRLATSRS